MRIEQDDMKDAVNAGLLSQEQAQKVWSFWQQGHENTPQFRVAHVMYYFGGLLAISAVTLFVTQAWDTLRGMPLFWIASLAFLGGLGLARYFKRRQLVIPAGIMTAFSLVLVPLMVYNLQIHFNWLPNETSHYANYHFLIKHYWVPMEVVTLLAGMMMLYYYRFPFLMFPIAVTLWYMSMDLFPLLFPTGDYEWRGWFSIVFGLIYIAIAIATDFITSDERKDYAFWLYIFGVIVFWSGFSFQCYSSEFSKLVYCLINISLVFVGVFLNRRVFTIFGVLGVFSYVSYLAFTVFANSLGFSLVLVVLGLLLIFAATQWVRMEQWLMSLFQPYMPQALLKRMRNDLN